MARWINSLSDSLTQSVEDPIKKEILQGTEKLNDQITPVKKAEMIRQVMLKMMELL
jgi:hypothetical protein